MRIGTNLFDLSGKTAIITGGAQGIGEAIGLGFAHYGADLVVADRQLEKARKVADAAVGIGRRAMAFELDVSDKIKVERMVSEAVEEYGRIDILVNCAGMNIRNPVIDISEDDWDKILSVNLKGTFLCCQAVGRIMIGQKKGKIINMASVSSVLAHPERATYAASKGGVIQITKVMANEWAKYNINVNAISPAAVDTAFIAGMKSSDEKLKTELSRIPLGRLAQPEDIVGTAIFLASEASDFVTGHNLFVDGGRTID